MSRSFITPNVPLQYCPLSYTTLDPSAPPLSTSCIQLPRAAGSVPQTRPSPYAFTIPAFVRAHPPALPKIFQPPSGSGTDTHPPGAMQQITTELCWSSYALCCTVYMSIPHTSSINSLFCYFLQYMFSSFMFLEDLV